MWVAGGNAGNVVRVQGGRIVRRIRVGEGVVGVAPTGDALWVSFSAGALGRDHRLVSIDAETGRQTGTLDLGSSRPRACSAGDDLWVVTLDGIAMLVR
jgi:hypothetical protein